MTSSKELSPMVRLSLSMRDDKDWALNQLRHHAAKHGRPFSGVGDQSLGLHGDLSPGAFTFALAGKTLFDLLPYPEPTTFRDFAAVLSEGAIETVDKSAVPLVSFVDIRGNNLRRVFPNGGYKDYSGVERRGLIRIVHITGIALDFDEGDTTVERIAARLRELELEGFVYTTHSHTPQQPRLRLILRLKDPSWLNNERCIQAQHHEDPVVAARALKATFRAKYNGVAKWLDVGTHDPACSDIARLHYLPSHKPGAEFRCEYIEGEALDLASVAPHWGTPKNKPLSFHDVGCDVPRASLADIEEALTHIPPCCSYPMWRDVLWAVHSAVFGTTDGDAGRELCEAWSRRCPAKFDPQHFADLWSDADANAGVTIATFFHHARQFGYDDQSSTIPISVLRKAF